MVQSFPVLKNKKGVVVASSLLAFRSEDTFVRKLGAHR
jgi:hypothetical protein